MRAVQFRAFYLTGISILLINTISVRISVPFSEGSINLETEAQARSSGGRSGGGSFSQPSSPSRSSSPSESSGSRSSSSPNSSNGSSSSTSSSSSSTSSADAPIEIIIGFWAIVFCWILFGAIKDLLVRGFSKSAQSSDRELTNDTVTISKLQVALLANAPDIQAILTQLSQNVDTGTSTGLLTLLQGSAMTVLNHADYWVYVKGQSATVRNRHAAQEQFNHLSIAERSKFNAETLSNANGQLRQRDLKLDPEEDPAAYIVVTLLVGTAHDKPLFDFLRTATDLTEALEALHSIPPDHLMVFELLWSPQDARDRLTEDELLTEYTDMVLLA